MSKTTKRKSSPGVSKEERARRELLLNSLLTRLKRDAEYHQERAAMYSMLAEDSSVPWYWWGVPIVVLVMSALS